MPDILATAIELHRNGEFASAANLYQQVLVGEPAHSDALHLLGVLRHQQGDHAGAVELIRRAIAVLPSTPVFHANLAEAYRALGQLERAVGACRMALRLWPDYPEALGNLGVALQGLGRHEEAIEHLRHALRLAPNLAAVHSNLGISLRQAGRRDEALTHFQHAVEFDPRSASARTNLGLLLIDSGRAAEALPHCQEAVRLRPDSAVLYFNLGNVLRSLDNRTEAKAAYTEALTLDPDLAAANANLAMLLQKENRFAEAVPWLRHAVELKPDEASWWEHLGDLHIECESPTDAIPCYERALILKPGRALTHNALGWALQEEGRPTEAEAHYRSAETINPRIPATQLNLGGLHEERGQLPQAEACFRAALKLNPAYAAPRARLAMLLRGKLPATDRAALEKRLAELQPEDESRPNLLFGLAQVLDAVGDFDRAAECLREANGLALEQAKKRRRDYDPSQHDQFVDNLLQANGSEFFRRTQGGGSPSRRPVFVFGMPRSGTTLIEQILASHSRVHGAGELALVRRSFEAIPALVKQSAWPVDCLPRLEAAALRHLSEQHLGWLRNHDNGAALHVVDKMPDNYLYLGLITALFPNAVLIHCRRDPRDVAVSCWMTHFRSIRWANDPGHIASRFAQYHRAMRHWREVLPARIHEVDYEETVDDLESVARRLVAACGLEWEAACLDFHRNERVVRTASVTQVRQPIYRRSVARWKHYEHSLADLFDRLPATGMPVSSDQFIPGNYLPFSPPNTVQEFV